MSIKTLLPVLCVLSVVLLFSCAKDKAQKPSDIDCTTIDQSANTYNLKIKTILDDNCASAGCHDAIFASSGVNLATYDASKAAFQNDEVLCTVKQEQGCLPMPQGAPKLADSLITYLSCWAENNYPQ